MDGILGVGPLELIVIVVLALVVLGPERLPGTIRQVVRFIRQARAIGTELTAQFSEELNLLDDFNPKKIMEEVVGLDEDEGFNAKSLLGIDEDDLKLDAGKSKKASTKTAAKTTANEAEAATSTDMNAVPSTAVLGKKRTKPALGEVDPEETSAVDAVVDETPSEPAAQEDTAVAAVSPIEERVESDAVDPGTENRIAPPSMTAAQSLVAGKTHKTESVATAAGTATTQASTQESPENVAADVSIGEALAEAARVEATSAEAVDANSESKVEVKEDVEEA